MDRNTQARLLSHISDLLAKNPCQGIQLGGFYSGLPSVEDGDPIVLQLYHGAADTEYEVITLSIS